MLPGARRVGRGGTASHGVLNSTNQPRALNMLPSQPEPNSHSAELPPRAKSPPDFESRTRLTPQHRRPQLVAQRGRKQRKGYPVYLSGVSHEQTVTNDLKKAESRFLKLNFPFQSPALSILHVSLPDEMKDLTSASSPRNPNCERVLSSTATFFRMDGLSFSSQQQKLQQAVRHTIVNSIHRSYQNQL